MRGHEFITSLAVGKGILLSAGDPYPCILHRTVSGGYAAPDNCLLAIPGQRLSGIGGHIIAGGCQKKSGYCKSDHIRLFCRSSCHIKHNLYSIDTILALWMEIERV
jgi:hypothetical protein